MHTRHTPLLAPAPTDVVWTVEHIALVLRREVRSARTVVAQPGFPAPFTVSPASNATRYWMPQSVPAYFARLQAAVVACADTSPVTPTNLHTPTDDPQAVALARLRALPKASGGAR